MLRVSRLSKRYGKTPALDGVDLDLGEGAVLAVIGANGAGKTTLIKCVVGLVHFSGLVEVDGIDVARHGKQARARIGYMPQNPAFHNDLTVSETALFYADLKGARHPRAREFVESVGLGGHAEKKVGALSGGMRQRLALAVALLADPPLLVLDEPASGLDISARLELRHLVQEQRERGKSVLLSTHWLEDVPHIADEALVLDHGHTAFLGPASELPGQAAASSRLYLRLNGHSPQAVPLIRSLTSDEAVDSSGDWLIVTCAASDKARVVEALLAAGVTILDFRVEEATVDAAIFPTLPRGVSV
jgi:ABC-type multidrug transport system ATPase subunit